MTVAIESRRQDEADLRARAAGGRRSSLQAADFRSAVLEHVIHTCAKELRDASALDFYHAFAHTVRDRLVHRWLATQRTHVEKDVKRVCYLSSEFLTGRSLGLCLMNMDLYDAAIEVAADYGLELGRVLECEGDPGLGNGGLGRLAACFMDSLATLELPAIGYGIRYDFGMFEQKIDGGRQVEQHDNWLQLGNTWELPRHEEAQTVRFGGHVVFYQDRQGGNVRTRASWVDTRAVIGLPYDSFIVGHRTDTANTLRLWAARATRDFDLQFFNEGDFRRAVEEKIDTENISKVLYPNDQSEEGKTLRLKQQYFFVACSIADIVRRYKLRHTTFDAFADKFAIQLNDTHPSIAVAELMRVLLDEEGLDWDAAWAITEKSIGYTNHTLLPEALERWPVKLFERLLPRHLQIIYEINHRFLHAVQIRWPGDNDRIGRMSIIDEAGGKQVRMAHLATVGAHSVNGVAKLHSDLVKANLLADFHELWPERFNNKTNGVTPRRWLLHSNPRLTRLLTSKLGSGWIDLPELSRLQALTSFADDEDLLDALHTVKQANKREVIELVRRRCGVELPAEAMFVAQIKRFHEYKRQLLACLQIVAHYLTLKRDPGAPVVPRAYLFAGKAAPGYVMAKLHIRLLNDVAAVINADPAMHGRLAMAFVPNYGVSLAQAIIPAADLSLQISTAGKEASGTSNMKFALNGALTLGTLDGANIEIRDAVGHENFFLFGLTTEEVAATRAAGYDPRGFIGRSPALAEAMELIESGFFSLGERDRYRPILDGLRYSDPYMVCADFDGYLAREAEAAEVYRDAREWSRRALFNIAGSSRFSSDATIRQYASEIWGLTPVKTDFGLLSDRR
ncbi:MAG TPA: glycogen/starch/alpha-glucan phosphorylase [Polyangia bacterium]|jgi:starch phosphorylase|nr:glycogen/starch/alpha-glucan phosphorylase [Polyangia bacterium]